MNASNSKLIDVMIDLETLGTQPGCVILSIGAALVDPEVIEHNTDFDLSSCFYSAISTASCYDVGLGANQATIDWWNKQNEAAREEAFSGSARLSDVLSDFSTYISRLRAFGSVRVWGNAASFDLKILEAAYSVAGMPVPWSYKEEMCYRTLKNLFPQIKATAQSGLVTHHALNDAMYQALHAFAILTHIETLR